ALMTGMRREELLGLRWQDVNLEEGALEIHQSVVFIGGKAVFDNPKTQESEREVMLDAGTVAILRDQQQHVAEMRAAAGASWREHDLVFP
ncbi:tyrosine-type recombinase/integrase, partial [Acinetobacter baumannii]